jgi:hypothetical protein
MGDKASDGLSESVFPRAVVLTSVLPLDRKWASRTLTTAPYPFQIICNFFHSPYPFQATALTSIPIPTPFQ